MQSGGFTGKGWKLNLNIPNTLDLAEAIISQNKLNKAYKRITNKKLDVIHNYACSIIAEKPSSIVMEDLSVKSMYIDKSEDISYKQKERHNKISLVISVNMLTLL